MSRHAASMFRSARGVPVLVGRMRRLFVPGGLVVAGRHALRGDVQMPAVRHPFGHDAAGSPVHGDEFDGVHAGAAQVLGPVGRVVPAGKRSTNKIYIFDVVASARPGGQTRGRIVDVFAFPISVFVCYFRVPGFRGRSLCRSPTSVLNRASSLRRLRARSKNPATIRECRGKLRQTPTKKLYIR